MQGILLNPGKAKVFDAINNNTKLSIKKVEIGTAINLQPLAIDTVATPTVSIIVDGSNVFKTVISSSEIIFTTIMDETVYGKMGNLLYRLSDETPLFKLYLPVQYDKQRTNTARNSPGDKFFFHFRIRLPGISAVFSPMADYYADMIHKDNFDSFEFKASAEYEQYMVENESGRMVFAGKINGIFYGTPWMMNVKDAGFWRYFGGYAGDNYQYVTQPRINNA